MTFEDLKKACEEVEAIMGPPLYVKEAPVEEIWCMKVPGLPKPARLPGSYEPGGELYRDREVILVPPEQMPWFIGWLGEQGFEIRENGEVVMIPRFGSSLVVNSG